MECENCEGGAGGMRDLFLVGVTLLIIGVAGLLFMGFQGKAFSFSSMWGDVESFERTESFNRTEVEEIEVDVSSADIQLLASESDSIEVRYYGNSNHREKVEKAFYATMRDNALDIGTKSTVNFGISFQDLNLEIAVPKKQLNNLTINSSSGDVQVEGLKAKEMELKLSSGDIHFKNVQSPHINIRTSSGSVEGEKVKGDLSVGTSSGDIDLSKHSLNQNVDVHSSSGDIRIQASEEPSSLYVQFDSSSGEAEIDFPMQFSSMDESHVKGTVGEGEHTVQVNTSSGDFELRR